MTLISTFAVALTLASSALARTDLTGCTSTDLVIKPSQGTPYASRLYYVPDTGEVCAFLDCGGGRAPPKSTVPGCPLYTGTETYSPSFINPKTLGNAVASSSTTTSTSTTPAPASSSASSAPATSTTVTSVTSASGTQSGSSSAQITTAPSSATSSSGNKTAEASSSAVKTKDTNAAGAVVPAIGGVVAALGAAFALL